MLFHIKQMHAPEDCPYGRGGSTSLFDGESKDVKVHGYWLAFPQHTTYLVVETEDVVHLQTFLKPGAGVTTCEITPVSIVQCPSLVPFPSRADPRSNPSPNKIRAARKSGDLERRSEDARAIASRGRSG